MTAIADRHSGTVDELQGDAILILFGAPEATDDRDHAVRAVQMAVEMQHAMTALNASWRRAGISEEITVRMGIHTGVVTIGNFGSPQRMKDAALGKHVNLAARLQTNCEPGKILLSHATWLLASDRIECTAMGAVMVKGIVKPVLTYAPDMRFSER
jgi:class 3 adenylate cyclase